MDTTLGYLRAYDMIACNIGNHYTLYSSSHSGTDYKVTGGIIDNISKEDGQLIINLKDERVERFTLSIIKDIRINENHNIIKLVYSDSSYFIIYITEKRMKEEF